MPLTKCPRCATLFNRKSAAVCESCYDAEETDFVKVREALTGDPTLDASGLAEESGVEVSVVLRMLDQGKVSVAETGGESVRCGRCGAAAISVVKKLCESCLADLDREMVEQKRKLTLGEKKDVEISGFGTVREVVDAKRRNS